ncbi:epoxide hydrolase [Pseudomonas fluorescens]|uniref:Putative epoxide hydrolase n=1 Tax=Pseudomonas fluorescens (strain Pf0-1) TaxID=205922 RepID=Q3K468_PSEPF|nr:epoxide hydrolase family protein [Pseudomonas fluorescens]ABA77436.1 putative epoxide hydrolase [Pseudomonas fluorescens Pf0-1]MBY9022629.1 epoxide hydrolase [Pseudomonas fluorescens]MBY9028621.1 epoxide hydrolase [Pseudomonas fluorescens]MBY9033820.1 epoxide hydrolase [Pseudomonas fluorescens]MBY9040271.1 epoxide hydrolase [Pseudomonas fluorescens]
MSIRHASPLNSIAVAVLLSAGTLMSVSPFAHAQNGATATVGAVVGDTAIRPFKVEIPEDAIIDLKKRVLATRWPDPETVKDQSQGVQQDKLKALVDYWGKDYDWHKVQNKLNALPMYITRIDGVDIQFIHVKSKHPNALPLLLTHGWPGSILEFTKSIAPLTDPTSYGGRAEDAFDVIIPSMPGYGFSQRPTEGGWGPERMGAAWDVLMKRLGYKNYVSQGGDWGSVVADAMGRQAPSGLRAIHVNMPATVPPEIARAINDGTPPPAGITPEEKAAYQSLKDFFGKNAAYGSMMSTRPQTVGYALSDSPAGLAAWIFDKFNQWTYSGGDAEKSLSKDEMLDDISLYWLTNSAVSSARLYWENNNNNFNSVEQKTREIKVPVAVTVFPGEIYQAPKTWAERAYPTLKYYNVVNKGGHFAAWEEPELFASELRKAFKPYR